MTNTHKKKFAEVISVFPNKIRVAVHNLEKFKTVDEQIKELKIGSYLEISEGGHKLIAVIESYQMELRERIEKDADGKDVINEDGKPKRETYNAYVIDAKPLGTIANNIFIRGGDSLTIPPTNSKPADEADIKLIFESDFQETKNKVKRFCFAKLAQKIGIEVPVDGNKFFNKHFAIVGSSGSGKSHTTAKILQKAIEEKKGDGFTGLNNSHVVIFDIHNEYKTAFPDANFLDITTLTLPYWLLNTEELEELFLESGDFNNYNQSSVLRNLIVENKKIKNPDFSSNIYFDSPLLFNLNEIINALVNLSNETKNAKNSNKYMIDDDSYALIDDKTTVDSGIEINDNEKLEKYFKKVFKFFPIKGSNIKKGEYADGTLDKFISRIENKFNDKRLAFLLGDKSKKISFEDSLKQFIGYNKFDKKLNKFKNNKSNVTVIDLSGIPFEVLSITVSLISRILFDYGYFYKKYLTDGANLETPLLLVYEEAHRYVPSNESAKFKASTNAIERIAKEGRKYGVTLGIVSQRPSEISETIFSQCNNFIAMRLTNPADQNYVKRLLPDALGNLVDNLPSLQAGEGLLLGESIIMPSLVKIEKCDESRQPSSNDVKYLETWKEEWKDVKFDKIIEKWKS